MIWRFIPLSANKGKYNMDWDIETAYNLGPNEAYFRLYRWDPYCISLGANQKIDDIDTKKCSEDGIEIVTRPTGGRAILHAEEITYSLILPVKFGLTSREIYEKTSLALVEGLKKFSKKLAGVELENIQPNFGNELAKPSGGLCFASTARSEVKFNGKKIIGSAQRKMNHSILQHGSILAGKFHTKLPEYLSDKENKEFLINELSEKTTEIETITGEKVDYNKLAENMVNSFADFWQIQFETKQELV
jgi:lipoate-protein ligase A